MSAEVPETKFTRSAGRSVAFQVCGDRGPDLVFTPGSFNNVDVWWEHPVTSGFLRSLASFNRLILFDRRGTGASDPLPSDDLPIWEDWVADLRAVLDAAGSQRTAILASLDGGPTALALAAEEPGRVTKLVLCNTTARYRRAYDYPCGASEVEVEAVVGHLRETWGTEAFSLSNYPDRADDPDFLRWYAKYQRASIGQGRVEAVARSWFDIDARPLIARVRAPTLVLQRESYRVMPESHGLWLAEHLAEASLVLLPGASSLFGRDADTIVGHVRRFLTGGYAQDPAPSSNLADLASDVFEDSLLRAAAEISEPSPSEVQEYVDPMGSSPVRLSEGSVLGKRYRLKRLLGQGGMGIVWEATHLVTRRRVAIKLVMSRTHQSKDLRRRFLREARAASAARHPNVVEVLDVFELDDGTPAMVMELLTGETLRDRLTREGKLTLDVTASLFLPVLAAVGAAHALGIVHRDLKPENVFLVAGVEPGQGVKVLDFGVAKVTMHQDEASETESLTVTGSALGTPCYMAPEQATGQKDIDALADVWALGVMFYECLAGARPVQGAGVGQVVMKLFTEGIKPLGEVVPDLPTEASALVMRMLSRARNDRPQTLQEVADALARFKPAPVSL